MLRLVCQLCHCQRHTVYLSQTSQVVNQSLSAQRIADSVVVVISRLWMENSKHVRICYNITLIGTCDIRSLYKYTNIIY